MSARRARADFELALRETDQVRRVMDSLNVDPHQVIVVPSEMPVWEVTFQILKGRRQVLAVVTDSDDIEFFEIRQVG